MAHEEPVIRRPLKPDDEEGLRPGVYVYGGLGAAVAAIVVVLLIVLIGGGDVVDPGWLDDEAAGKIVYCSGEDVSRSQQRSVEDFNKSSARGTAEARLVTNFPKADEQRLKYLELIDSGDCDVVYLDVIYTPEFASRKLLYDVTPYLERDDLVSLFNAQMISTATYAGKLWGVPKAINAGVVYYRRDKVPGGPPRTWKKLVKAAESAGDELPGLRLQLDAYEGLTVTFLELAYAAGADPIVSEDGKTANVDQDGTREALKLLRNAIAHHAVPRSVTRLTEEKSLLLFSLGRARFLRGWPYIEARLKADADDAERQRSPSARARRTTADNLGVEALPPWVEGGRRVAILGGSNLVIPRTAKNPEGALHLINFLTSEQQILRDAATASLASVLPDLDDRKAVRGSRALAAVQDETLRLRPPITSYWKVSDAISSRLRRVLNNGQGEDTFPDELQELQVEVQRALDQQ